MNKLLLALLLNLYAVHVYSTDMEITPFRTTNQSPLVHIFGFPHDSGADSTAPGATIVSLTTDISSNYTVNSNEREQITLDGEMYRTTLAVRHGFGRSGEIGIELPWITAGGGFLDSLIIDWHRAFGLPQGGRDHAPKNRIEYRYTKDGVRKLEMGRSSSGIGDISLTAGISLYDSLDGNAHDRLSLKTALKLPTGDSSFLHGSGSTDFSLSLCGSMNNFTEWGSVGLYGSAGGLAMTKGSVLSDQQNNLAGFGMVGLGWGPANWISFKVQLNGHTALYRDSSLTELSRHSLMLVSGGTLKLPEGYLLDIGVSEDVAVSTAPDVSFHLGLSKRF